MEKWTISTLQTKDKSFLKQLQPKSPNGHFHTPAANSLLLQKNTWHITTHFVVEGHIYAVSQLNDLRDVHSIDKGRFLTVKTKAYQRMH